MHLPEPASKADGGSGTAPAAVQNQKFISLTLSHARATAAAQVRGGQWMLPDRLKNLLSMEHSHYCTFTG